MLYDFIPPLQDRGWDTLFKKYSDFMRLTEGPISINWTDTSIEVDNGLAMFRGIAHLRARYKDGRSVDGQYRYTAVLKKKEGEWTILHEHSSMPAAAKAMKP